MASILGWKDVLRPIRDGYRHLFPAPDTGPTPEERAKQRELDRSKGFTYFDTFTQLQAWTKGDSDLIQRANTPLLPRSCSNDTESGSKAALLLCHDYSGNYHDYESAQQFGVEEESYTCEYLQHVDTFVYFSHKLVCVPPPSWTNTLHRNGVIVLGTVLVEPQTKDADCLLLQSGSGSPSANRLNFPLAKQLADIAVHYGFDGWLINIEKPFSTQGWDTRILEAFLRQLRSDLGPSRSLIWYDALTKDNQVVYQNALNTKNISFSQACGKVLTNYSWKERDALKSKQLALGCEGLSPENIFFGIDVWAQNKAPLTRRRITFPEKDGGGTLVGTAVSKLSEIGLSAGIFAPAWTFEHFSGDHGLAVEQCVWEGSPLPDVTCSCGNAEAQHPSTGERGVACFAKQFPAGSGSFFYTDFSRGFAMHSQLEADKLYDRKPMHSQLASQSVSPHVQWSRVSDQSDNGVNILSARLEDVVGRTQLVVETHSAMPPGHGAEKAYERWLPIFAVDMVANGSLQLHIDFSKLLRTADTYVDFYMKFNDSVRFLHCHSQTIDRCVEPEDGHGGTRRLQEIGVHVRSPHFGVETVRILEVQEIRIVPLAHLIVARDLSIKDIRLVKRGNGETEHWRLRWTYLDKSKDELLTPDSPYSAITGPFSHFLLRVDGVNIGRAHALEHVVPAALTEELGDRELRVQIIGVSFDGRELAQTSRKVRI